MGPIAAELDKAEMLTIAKYFSEQKWPTIQTASSDQQIAIGERIGTSGQCTQCHLGGYNGVSGTPQLAGQTPEYLEKTMLDVKVGEGAFIPEERYERFVPRHHIQGRPLVTFFRSFDSWFFSHWIR